MTKQAPLFREEVFQQQSGRLIGEVILIQPLSTYLISFFLTLMTLGTVGLLVWGKYTPKETVLGYLSPNTGLIKVYSSSSGIVEQVHFQEGKEVNKGDLLYSIRPSNSLNDGQSMPEALLKELAHQKDRLQKRMEEEKGLSYQNEKQLLEKITKTNQKLFRINELNEIRLKQFQLQEKKVARLKLLAEGSHSSLDDYEKEIQLLLEKQEQLNSAERELLDKQESLAVYQNELKQIPLLLEKTFSSTQLTLSQLEERIIQTKGQSKISLTATTSGVISSIEVQEGQFIIPNQLLVSILPSDAFLNAVLLVPSRAIGFVKKGQKVKLRYDAFPFEKFGIYYGEIFFISKTILMPEEIDSPFSIGEPVYKIQTMLQTQQIESFGESFFLRTGMSLKADILLYQTTIVEWIFEPILSRNSSWN